MCAGMKIGVVVSGMGIVIPRVSCVVNGDWGLGGLGFARTALAEGLERVKVRIAEITAEVRFSRS